MLPLKTRAMGPSISVATPPMDDKIYLDPLGQLGSSGYNMFVCIREGKRLGLVYTHAIMIIGQQAMQSLWACDHDCP